MKEIKNTFVFKPKVEELNASLADNMAGNVGLVFTEIGDDYLKAKMPVDKRTIQPFGLLHGGASVVLAETVGSMAANLCVDTTQFYCVGLEINANHLRGVREGWVHAVARPLHIGKSTQVWDIRISDDADRPVCVSRLTMAVIAR